MTLYLILLVIGCLAICYLSCSLLFLLLQWLHRKAKPRQRESVSKAWQWGAILIVPFVALAGLSVLVFVPFSQTVFWLVAVPVFYSSIALSAGLYALCMPTQGRL